MMCYENRTTAKATDTTGKIDRIASLAPSFRVLFIFAASVRPNDIGKGTKDLLEPMSLNQCLEFSINVFCGFTSHCHTSLDHPCRGCINNKEQPWVPLGRRLFLLQDAQEIGPTTCVVRAKVSRRAVKHSGNHHDNPPKPELLRCCGKPGLHLIR